MRIQRALAAATLLAIFAALFILVDIRSRVEEARVEAFEHQIPVNGELVLVRTERRSGESLQDWIARHNRACEAWRDPK